MARISTDFLSTQLRKRVFAYDQFELPLKDSGSQRFFFFGQIGMPPILQRKKEHFELSARVRFAVTHGAEGFNQGVNLPVNIKKKKTLFCVPINENNFQIQTTVIF